LYFNQLLHAYTTFTFCDSILFRISWATSSA
jgi:hypothetical protein